MIGVFLAMLGCGPAPVIPWTEEGAILPTLEILDLDKSGGIEPGEWMRVSYGAAPFNELDSNGSGALDGIELLAWVRGADPDGFDGKRVTLRPNDGKPAGPGPVAPATRCS